MPGRRTGHHLNVITRLRVDWVKPWSSVRINLGLRGSGGLGLSESHNFKLLHFNMFGHNQIDVMKSFDFNLDSIVHSNFKKVFQLNFPTLKA